MTIEFVTSCLKSVDCTLSERVVLSSSRKDRCVASLAPEVMQLLESHFTCSPDFTSNRFYTHLKWKYCGTRGGDDGIRCWPIAQVCCQ